MSEWISVKDKLPPYNEEVLVYYIHHSTHHNCDFPVIEIGRYLDHWVQLQGENVTHWMPLPEPPKEPKP